MSKILLHPRKARAALAVLGLLAATSVRAQTDGTLTLVTNSGVWSTAPWVITSGSGTFPDGGGDATFANIIGATPGTIQTTASMAINTTPVTLSGIAFDSIGTFSLTANTGGGLVASSAGLTIQVNSTYTSTPTLFFFGSGFSSANISGGGAAGLVYTGTSGNGSTLSGNNSYTGGTHVSGGMRLLVSSGDGAFGATGAGNGLEFDNATLFVNSVALNTTRNVTLGGGGLTLIAAAATTFGGVISGNGALSSRLGASALTFSANNTYTGATTFGGPTQTVTLTSSGSLAASSSYDMAGTLSLNNVVGNLNRLNDVAPITARGATLSLMANGLASTTEAAGALTLAGGFTTLSVTPNAAVQGTLGVTSITRQGAALLGVRGTNLGATPASNVAQITSTSSPGTLVGGGGAAGSTNISILPWAVGSVSSSSFNNGSLVTWDSSTGRLRPLATSEYAPDFTGGPTDNVRITSSAVAPGSATANALLFQPSSTGQDLSGGTIAITSGALLYGPTTNVSNTISAPLDFGAAEGVIVNASTSALTLSGVLSGTGGVTFASLGGNIVLSGNNTFTGPTTLVSGTLSFSGVITAGSPGPLGASTSAIVIQPGSLEARLSTNSTLTINRDLEVQNTGPGVVRLNLNSSNTSLTVNGNINLQRELTLDGAAIVTNGVTLNGIISGPGSLTDVNNSFNILNNPANSFSGGINMMAGTWVAGADNAFGTGAVYISSTAKIQSADATAHTLGNDLIMAANATFQGNGSLTFTGAAKLGGIRTIAVTLPKLTLNGVVSEGGITKSGAGTLNLASPTGNTYTGGTVISVNGGTLEVNNTSGSGTGLGAVLVNTGASLIGNFNISGATQMNGTLAPGTDGIGTASFGGDLALGSAAVTNLELASLSSYDSISVAGLLTLDGTLNIVTAGSYVAVGSFYILSWGTLNSSGFNVSTDLNLSGAALQPNGYWDTSQLLTNGLIIAVPEPSMWGVLMGAGGLGFVLLRRRRRWRSHREPAL